MGRRTIRRNFERTPIDQPKTDGLIEPANGPELVTGNDIPTVDAPTSDDAGTGDSGTGSPVGDAPKRRGRKPGSTNRKASVQVNITGLEKILYSSHLMIAAFTKSAELAITEDEAKSLADAAQNVASFYNVGATQKQVAWVNLATTMGFIYGPRFVAMYRNAPVKTPKPVTPKPFEVPRPMPAHPVNGHAANEVPQFDGSAPED